MKGKNFEAICQQRMDLEDEAGTGTMSRCGVMAVLIEGKWQPIPSYPDFEGITSHNGRQFVTDCKVCSGASLSLDDSKLKQLQLKHMLRRDRNGATCFLLIHFKRRELKTKTVEAITYAFPVSEDLIFWERHARGEVKRINRADCEEVAVVVEWNTTGKGRKPRPDILSAVRELRKQPTERERHNETFDDGFGGYPTISLVRSSGRGS